MEKPIIGVLLDYETRAIGAGGYADLPWYALRANYAKALSENGAIALHIPYEHSALSDYLKICNGFMIPGGDYDIHPSYYKEDVHPKSVLSNNRERTEFELALLKTILRNNIPFLGICAGHQVLNVALGGTLHQDINSNISTNINHKVKNIQHDIELNEASLLYEIMKEKRYKVNSYHHQAINKLGKNLIVSSHANDGVIESIEHTGHPFCIGVEWHPEYQQIPQDQKLLKAFVEAARKHRLGKS